MGRTARGVRGIRMPQGAKCISLSVLKDANNSLLFATEKGFGKRTKVREFTAHARGTQGVIAIQTSEKTGNVLVSRMVNSEDEIMLITNGGVLIRTRVSEIREMGRATQGVRLINLGEGESWPVWLKSKKKKKINNQCKNITLASGPSVLPKPVIEKIKSELSSYNGTGHSLWNFLIEVMIILKFTIKLNN